MKKVVIEFADSEMANSFRDEMKKRFHYPKSTSKYQVVPGYDENGNTVFVGSNKQPGVFTKTLLK